MTAATCDPVGSRHNSHCTLAIPSSVKNSYDALRACLAELPERVGQAFASVELDHRDLDEVAQALQLKRNNLYVLLHRARKKLRACLEKNWFQEQRRIPPSIAD